MSLLCLIFLATGIQQKSRDAVDLLEELLGMPSMREIEAPFFSDSTGAVRLYFIPGAYLGIPTTLHVGC